MTKINDVYLDMTRKEVKIIQQITREQMIKKARKVKQHREEEHRCSCFDCIMAELERNLDDEKFYNDFKRD